MRKPNAECEVCKKPVYKRPRATGYVYCDKTCYAKARSLKKIKCQKCGTLFQPWKKTSQYCSKLCSNKSKIGMNYGKYKFPGKSATDRRLNELKDKFDFKCCMVEGCAYDQTYDVHRLIPGKKGGKYEIGNMFAICPNHHAEEHRKIGILEKINDCKLKMIYGSEPNG